MPQKRVAQITLSFRAPRGRKHLGSTFGRSACKCSECHTHTGLCMQLYTGKLSLSDLQRMRSKRHVLPVYSRFLRTQSTWGKLLAKQDNIDSPAYGSVGLNLSCNRVTQLAWGLNGREHLVWKEIIQVGDKSCPTQRTGSASSDKSLKHHPVVGPRLSESHLLQISQ